LLAGFGSQVVSLCRKLRVPVVADEVLGAPATFAGSFFTYQLTQTGFVPDFVLIGKSFGLTCLMVKLHKANTVGSAFRGNIDTASYLRMFKTIAADSFSLDRASNLVDWILDQDILSTGQEITKAFPELLAQANLPLPIGGSGFLWKFAKKDRKKFKLSMRRSLISNVDRWRFPLNTSIADIEQLLQ
jgi:4-aminobutyrate aminotransferase-like enzyme